MELPSACRFFRARVSTRASYAPLRPLVVTASASALRDQELEAAVTVEVPHGAAGAVLRGQRRGAGVHVRPDGVARELAVEPVAPRNVVPEDLLVAVIVLLP